MRNPSLTASPKQRQRRNTGDTRNLMVTPPVFRLPSLTAVDDWNARVDGGTYQISSLHPRQPLPAVIITPCTPEKKPPSSSLAFTPSSDGTASSSVPATPLTPQLPKITQPVFVNPGPEDDDEDIALKRVMEDLEYALIQRDKEDINPFDVSPSLSTNKDPDLPSFNISQSLQISLSKQSQDSANSSSDDASWDIPWESSSGKVAKYITSTPLLSWQGQHEDPFTNPKNVIKSPLPPPPYTDLFDLDMYLEASLAIANSNNTIDLGVCSLESENPFEDTFAVEPEPEPVITVSPSENVAVLMNRSVKERDVYRPSGYTRSPRFRFSVDENGSPVPLRPPLTQERRGVGARMTIVDQVRAVLEDESCDEEESGDDNDTSEISMPALKARLREACRKPRATTSLGVTTSGATSLLTGHGSLRASLAASQRKSLPLLTGSPRASLVVASSLAASSGSHSSLAASPRASLPVATLASSQHTSLTPSQHTSLTGLRPSSRLLRDITNTMTTSTSSSSMSTLASMAPNPTTVQKNPISVLMQNPIKSETPMTMPENPISTSIKLKTRNPIARFGRDIANIVVDDSANSVSLCRGNTTMASVYTMESVYSGENTTGSVYSVQNTMGSVYTMTYPDEASARALKARLRQACDKITKSVWVEECDTVQSWEPVPF